MSQQHDLFAAPPPAPNAKLYREWDRTSSVLWTQGAIPWERHSMVAHGKTIPMPRMECFLALKAGATYRYSGVEYTARAVDMVPGLRLLLASVSGEMSAAYGVRPNAVFANLYRDGQDSIGWHSDDEPSLGRTRDVVIASLSLGARRRFNMKHRTTGATAGWSLGQGDLLIMGPGCQSDWLHCVPKTAKPVGQRINLTFRYIEDRP